MICLFFSHSMPFTHLVGQLDNMGLQLLASVIVEGSLLIEDHANCFFFGDKAIRNHCRRHNRRRMKSFSQSSKLWSNSLAKLLSINDHVNMFLLKMFMPGSWSWPSWSGRASHRSCPMLSPLSWTGSTSRPGQNQLEKIFDRRSKSFPSSISANMHKSESDLEIGGVENGCAGWVVNVAGRNQVSEISRQLLHDP